MITRYREKHSEWIFIRHEDLSADPISGFKGIFERLNLEFPQLVRRVIEKHSRSSNAIGSSTQSDSSKGDPPDFLFRDSRANIVTWKRRLTQSEIKRIRAQVEEISQAFYSNEDW